MAASATKCINCGAAAKSRRQAYRYEESGLPNLVLEGVAVTKCAACGESAVAIPRLARIHTAIARALLTSPRRLSGPQFRFLRKQLGFSGEELAKYLHTDKTKISKWERDEDPIGPATDRLMRLVVHSLAAGKFGRASAIAAHLPQISNEAGDGLDLHVDAEDLNAWFEPVRKVA